MIAKFHSAPGHSMETTLTISLPPVQSVKTSRAEREREKEREREWELEQTREREKRMKKEKKKEEQERKREDQEKKKEERTRIKEEQERERELAKLRQAELENERRQEREKEREREQQEKAMRVQQYHPERNVSYKDKFQRMREKYDKATSVHESSQHELNALNAKIKKLQAENELLIDAMLSSERDLYERYFPRSGSSSPLIGLSEDPNMPTPASFPSLTPSQAPASHSAQYNEVSRPPPYAGSSASIPGSMPPPSSAPTGAPDTSTSSGGYRTMPPPLSPNPPPTSASSNGTITASSMPPPSSATSNNSSSNGNSTMTAAQRSSVPYDASGSGGGRRLTEEFGVNGAGHRTPTRATSPMAVQGAETSREGEEHVIARSPKINGSSTPATPNGHGNGTGPRHHIEHSRETTPLGVTQPNHLRDNDVGMDNDNVDDDEGPAPPGPEAGAGVHSPMEREDEEEEEDERMDVDEEGDEVDEENSAAALVLSPSRASGIGSLRRGGRGHT